jgi:hypothetical protein
VRKRNFTSWLSAYSEWTAASEAPNQFHVWTAIGVLAGAMRRYVYRDESTFKWISNFYIVLCAPPGVATKSTTMALGEKLLRQVPGMDIGPSSTTWQRMIQRMAQAHRFTTLTGNWNDDWFLSSSMTVFASELGSFFDPSNREQSDILTDLWDGRDQWAKETKEHGNDMLTNPWINIVACTTPAWLSDNFPEKLIGGGLASRIVWVYGEKKRRLVPYPSQELGDWKKHKELEEKLVEDLLMISELRGQFQMTPEAIEWGTAWYNKYWQERPPHLQSDRYSGYFGRRQTHLHKIAMVVAVSQRQELIITKQDLEIADSLLLSMEPSMLNVFASIGSSPAGRCSKEIIVVLSQSGSLMLRALWRLISERYDERTIIEALRQLQFTNQVKCEGTSADNQVIHLVGDGVV